MSSSSAERLAQFRAKKKAEAEAELRRRRAWEAVTMAPVRRAIGQWVAGGTGGTGDQQQVGQAI